MIAHAEEFRPSRGRKLFFGYPVPYGHEAEYISRYRRHNQAVRDHFRDRPDQLLEVCREKGDGWAQLCPFLGVPTPAIKFPVDNKTKNKQML